MIGIGTVELPTKCSPNHSGKAARGTLRLTNVLHAPDRQCNIIGTPISNSYAIALGGAKSAASKGSINDLEGRPVAYFDSRLPLFHVKLRGRPVSPHTRERHIISPVGAIWHGAERDRWEEHQANLALSRKPRNDEYTTEEKQWLKENYKSEFHFLRDHGLSIYKDEDREEGRSILRAIMREEDDGHDEELDSIYRDDNSDGRLADRHFSSRELSSLNKECRSSMNFMANFGLDFYNDDDCHEAKAILQGIMHEVQLRLRCN